MSLPKEKFKQLYFIKILFCFVFYCFSSDDNFLIQNTQFQCRRYHTVTLSVNQSKVRIKLSDPMHTRALFLLLIIITFPQLSSTSYHFHVFIWLHCLPCLLSQRSTLTRVLFMCAAFGGLSERNKFGGWWWSCLAHWRELTKRGEKVERRPGCAPYYLATPNTT